MCIFPCEGRGSLGPSPGQRWQVEQSVRERQAVDRIDRQATASRRQILLPAILPRPPRPVWKAHIFNVDMSHHLDHSPATTCFQIRSIHCLSQHQLCNNFALHEHVREGPLSQGERVLHSTVFHSLQTWEMVSLLVGHYPHRAEEEIEAQGDF